MLKEILNIAKKIGREIDDTLSFTDSNPEHIANFPYHKEGCSRIKPLRVSIVGGGGLSWGSPPADPGNPRSVLSCPECGGTEE